MVLSPHQPGGAGQRRLPVMDVPREWGTKDVVLGARASDSPPSTGRDTVLIVFILTLDLVTQILPMVALPSDVTLNPVMGVPPKVVLALTRTGLSIVADVEVSAVTLIPTVQGVALLSRGFGGGFWVWRTGTLDNVWVVTFGPGRVWAGVLDVMEQVAIVIICAGHLVRIGLGYTSDVVGALGGMGVVTILMA